MKNKMALAVLFLLFIPATSVFAQTYQNHFGTNYVPEPRLIEPTTDKVDLSGRKELLFKWSPHEGSSYKRKYYDFRLYKGYNMYESNLIFKKEVAPNQHQLGVSSDIFEDGQVYTWSLRQKYRSGKSRRSTNSFTVIKR